MKVLVEAEVLAVGIDSIVEYLNNLPVRVSYFETAKQAISSLKYKHYDAVVSKWNLPDMANGKFLKGLKNVKPGISTVAIVDNNNACDEILARSCGINAVLTENSGRFIFSETLANLVKVPVFAGEISNSI